MDSFTPFVFGTKSGMGSKSQMFLKQLAKKLGSKERWQELSAVFIWMSTHLK